jgi:hypothetical protein
VSKKTILSHFLLRRHFFRYTLVTITCLGAGGLHTKHKAKMRRVAYTRTKWGEGEQQRKLAYRSLPAWRYADSYRQKNTKKKVLIIPPMPAVHELLIYIFKRRHGLKYDMLVSRKNKKISLYIHRV